jgi:hypothetical protein
MELQNRKFSIFGCSCEDVFELGTTAGNYGENYGTTGKSTADSTAGRDPHDRLGGRYRTDSKPARQAKQPNTHPLHFFPDAMAA